MVHAGPMIPLFKRSCKVLAVWEKSVVEALTTLYKNQIAIGDKVNRGRGDFGEWGRRA